MSTTAMHPLAADYLRRLRQAGRDLPAGRLDDLSAEIESHLAEAIPAGASDAAALSVIDRLGPPEEIVEAERPETAEPPGRPRRSWHETAAVVLLLVGGFAAGIGWIAGVVLLWNSRIWTTRDKLIGTLIVPGGLAAAVPALLLGTSPTTERCFGRATEISPVFRPGRMRCVDAGGPSTVHHVIGIVVFVAVIVGPICTAIYLSWRAGRVPRGA